MTAGSSPSLLYRQSRTEADTNPLRGYNQPTGIRLAPERLSSLRLLSQLPASAKLWFNLIIVGVPLKR
jgi:hypothetical protein